MSDGTPDARGDAARVIAALRAQAESAVDASIPVNPQDLLVLLAALDGQGAVHAPTTDSPMAPARVHNSAGEVEDADDVPRSTGQSIGDRYHSRSVRAPDDTQTDMAS